MMRKFVTWTAIKTEHGQGSWCIDCGMVRVVTQHGTKAAQIGGLPPDFLARLLMKELRYEHGPDVA